MRNILKNIKRENGAIATLVLFTILMFVAILMGVYLTITTMQKSQLKSDIRIKDIYGKDVERVNQFYNVQVLEYTSYDVPYIPKGFRYKEGSWNNGYTIIGNTENPNDEFVWVPCVIDQSQVKAGDTVVTFERILPKTTQTTDINYKYNQQGITDIIDIDSSATEIRESVGKYGGFYIAKYEAGINGIVDNSDLTIKTKVDGSIKPLSQPSKGLWNYITRQEAVTVSKAMINKTKTGVKSTLISGEAWDTTLQWMTKVSSNKASNIGYDTNSVGKGWYNDISSNERHTTGYYAVNNIYDMAGNVWEWTTESCTRDENNCLVFRGGRYLDQGSYSPAAFRFGSLGGKGSDLAFRVILYK